ncbi:hypothetical protein D3C87_197400 [compost metagenome]
MKIKLLFTGLCFCSLSYMGYGQAQTQALKESTPVIISSNPDLKTQFTKLDAKQVEIDQAKTVSRAQMGKLNDEFRVLKEEYVRLLSTELQKTTDAQLKAQLQQEITRYSDVKTSQTR